LFHAATVHGILPSESSPRQKSRTPLGATLLPCGHPPTCTIAAAWPLSPPVSATPTLSRGCLLPPTTMSSLFTPPKGRFPVTLGPRHGTRPVPPASPTSKPCSSHRVRSRRPGLPRADGRSSPGLRRLSEAFSPHARDPRPARARELEHAPSSEDSRARLEGPLDPPSRVSQPPKPKQTGQLVGRTPISFETGPRHLSAASLLPRP
jgi:hypothetical protein